MARIRSIKPEFWSHEKTMNCSRDARLLFIGMWNFADDAGRLSNSAKTIKAQVFPGDDDVASENIRRWIVELSSNDLLREYESEGRAYLQITGWHHQKIDRPKPSKIPAPPIVDESSNERRSIAPDLTLSNLSGSNLREAVPENSNTLPDTRGALPKGALAVGFKALRRPSEMSRAEIDAAIARKHS